MTKIQDFELWAKMYQNGQEGPRVPPTCCKVQKTPPDGNLHGLLMGTDIDEWRNSRPVRPDSCQNQGPSEARHDRGCLLPLEEWFKEKSLLVLIVGLAASLLQVWTLFKYTLILLFRIFKYIEKSTFLKINL